VETVEPSGAATGPGDPVDELFGAASGTTSRTHDLRASLEAIVSEAERVSEQLIAESRAAAAATTREADDRASQILDQARTAADVIRTRAEGEVEEHRRRVRAEVSEQVRTELVEQNRLELAAVRAQSQAVIGDLEASVRILGVSMESAVANIAEMLSALEQLRSHTADPIPHSPGPTRTPAQHSQFEPSHAADQGVAADADPLSEPFDEPASEPAYEHSAPSESVPVPASVFDANGTQEPDADARQETGRSAVPLTASEAFLQASSFGIEGGEGSGEQREQALAESSLEASEAREPIQESDADQGKPLGWLFRSPD
jgi:hypothetical protein